MSDERWFMALTDDERAMVRAARDAAAPEEGLDMIIYRARNDMCSVKFANAVVRREPFQTVAHLALLALIDKGWKLVPPGHGSSTSRSPRGERCHDCGCRYDKTIWHAPDRLWEELTRDGAGLLCPPCFSGRAWAKGILLVWEPRPDGVR